VQHHLVSILVDKVQTDIIKCAMRCGKERPCTLSTRINDARNIFSGVTGGSSTGYTFLTAALLASGLGYIAAPLPTLYGVFGSSVGSARPESIVLWQLIGAGVSMLVAPWTLSLKVSTCQA
jgi:hypothetical protein